MIDKESLILEKIISEYIKNPEPIGSEQLKSRLNIKISSSTIRSYFKKLESGGSLMQIHISSGRVPTILALKRYWEDALLPLDELNISDLNTLNYLADEMSIFATLKYQFENRFQELVNIESRYLLLIFDEFEVSIEYSNALERFLREFLGVDISELKSISSQVGAKTLTERLERASSLNSIENSGNRELARMFSNNSISESLFFELLNGDLIDRVEDGLEFFSKEYMWIKQDAKIENQDAKLLSIGHISRDFERFFNQLRKE